jgi:hypothetical protein
LPSHFLFFFKGASRAFKNEARKQENNFGRGRCAPLPFLWFNSPPPSPSGCARISGICIPLRRFWRCSGRGAKLAHAAASRNFCLGFFLLQNRVYSYARRVNKKPISIAPISPPTPSAKPLDTPLLPAHPFSQRPFEGARGVCIVAHHVRGQGKDGRGGAEQRSPSHQQRR